MEKKKIILLFLDYEGTIATEEEGKINEEGIKKMLKTIVRLEKDTGSEVHIHLVSPIEPKYMQPIIDRLDDIIFEYNRKNSANLRTVQGAGARFYNSDDMFKYKKILPISMYGPTDDGTNGKREYVKDCIERKEDEKRLKFAIYGGNGRNDTSAMEYINYYKKGFTICPNNSHEDAKRKANFEASQNNAFGINEGLDYICTEIEKRAHNTKNENQSTGIGIDD